VAPASTEHTSLGAGATSTALTSEVPVDIWTWLWIGWIAIFAVIEGAAVLRKASGDTLSEHVWKWFAIGRGGDRPRLTGWVPLRRFALLAGLTWLVVHLLTGGLF
jgi:hypothetical protein